MVHTPFGDWARPWHAPPWQLAGQGSSHGSCQAVVGDSREESGIWWAISLLPQVVSVATHVVGSPLRGKQGSGESGRWSLRQGQEPMAGKGVRSGSLMQKENQNGVGIAKRAL